jgi:preprotein translocase subunit SecB
MKSVQTFDKSAFKFEGFIINRTLFERKDGEIGHSYNIQFNIKATHYIKQNKYKLFVTTEINDSNGCLTINIDCTGSFSFNPECEEKILKNFFYVNAPAILFPYIRAYISTISVLSGYSVPITIPTINFSSLTSNLEKNTIVIED